MKHPRRAVVDAILYVVRTGCAWRQLPADFPPWQTVYWYFVRWEQAKATEKILPVGRAQLRQRRTVDILDQAVDHRLRVDEDFDAVEPDGEKMMRLNQFEAFVHHRRRIDADLGAH